MSFIKKSVVPVLAATVWISISEFFRNEFLVKSYWVNHFQQKGLVFPSEPINGAVWGIWSLAFAIVIRTLSGKFNLIQTTLLSWWIGFMLMWLVIGNLGVLPFGILGFAVPLSFLEAFVASWMIKRLMER